MEDESPSGVAAPRVLITDTCRWAEPARLAISLANAGCKVWAVSPSPSYPLLKAGVVRKIYPYSGVRPLRSIVKAIEASDPDLILPCDDRAVQHLHELHERSFSDSALQRQCASLLLRSLGAPESYSVVSSRLKLLTVAAEEGILVPESFRLESAHDLEHRFRGQTWVLKADGTWGGGGVRIVASLKEAEEALSELTASVGVLKVLKSFFLNRNPHWLISRIGRPAPDVIAQSYIPGRPSNCAVVCWKGRILAGISVEVLSSSGPTGPAGVVRVVKGSEMMYAAERIAARLRLSGFFGLDFVVNEKSGETCLIEMNPRSTPLCHLQLGIGRDMASAISQQLIESRCVPQIPAVTDNHLISYFPQSSRESSELVATSFEDVPLNLPALMDELLHPWSTRTLLGRLVDALRRRRGKASSASPYYYPDPVSSPERAMSARELK